MFSTVAASFHFPTSNAQGFQFLHILTNMFYFQCLNYSHPLYMENYIGVHTQTRSSVLKAGEIEDTLWIVPISISWVCYCTLVAQYLHMGEDE